MSTQADIDQALDQIGVLADTMRSKLTPRVLARVDQDDLLRAVTAAGRALVVVQALIREVE